MSSLKETIELIRNVSYSNQQNKDLLSEIGVEEGKITSIFRKY